MTINNAQNAPALAQSAHSPAQIRGAGAYEAPAGKDFPLHHHSDWELVYYRHGKIQGMIGTRLYEIEPGIVLITPPATPHNELARTAYANYFLTVDAPVDQDWPIFCRDGSDGEMERIFAAIVREWSTDSLSRSEMLSLLLRQLDIAVARASLRQSQSSTERLVAEAARILEERFASRPQIAEVAYEVGASPSTLRRQFARMRGRSPMTYLHEIRARHAISLLRTSDLTLEAIAGMCGYDSASHLSRHVKRTLGKSPGQLRMDTPPC